MGHRRIGRARGPLSPPWRRSGRSTLGINAGRPRSPSSSNGAVSARNPGAVGGAGANGTSTRAHNTRNWPPRGGDVADPYSNREQTGAKHFILKRYLQAAIDLLKGYFKVQDQDDLREI